jgi:hypothetical protein
MSDSVSDVTARDARIRERAYYLWQENGCPEGRSDEFWAVARAQIDAQGSVDRTPVDPVPDTRPEREALREAMEATAESLAAADVPRARKSSAAKAPAKPRAKRPLKPAP